MRLDSLLEAASVVHVELVEVLGDDGHRDGDREHAGQRAQRPHALAEDRLGHEVAVTHCCHRAACTASH